MNKYFALISASISLVANRFIARAGFLAVYALLAIGLLSGTNLSAQYVFNNAPENGNTYVPNTTSQTLAMGNGAYVRMITTNGGNFHWDVCGFTGYDTYMTGFNSASVSAGTTNGATWANDDYCAGVGGNNYSSSTLALGSTDWVSTFAGTSYIQLNKFSFSGWQSGFGSATLTYSCTKGSSVIADGTFGTNVWNVFGYNSPTIGTNYSGYYTISATSFDTRLGVANSTAQSWNQATLSPSYASGYLGCPINQSNDSYRFMRKGFPCGYYTIYYANDDAAYIKIDGVSISSPGCCTPGGAAALSANFGSFYLGPNSTIEFGVTQGGGDTYGALQFNSAGTLAITSASSVCYGGSIGLTANYAGQAGSTWAVTSGGTYGSISGSTFTNNNTTGNIQYVGISYSTEGCTVTQTIAVGSNPTGATPPTTTNTTTQTTTGTFGNGQWDIYVYNAGDAAGGSGSWSSNYVGYYTVASLGFNTTTASPSWVNGASISTASNYTGCYSNPTSMSWSCLRTGVPCGIYTVAADQDDRGEFYINGTNYYGNNSCCTALNTIGTYVISPSDLLCWRVSQGGGGAYGEITFTSVTPSALSGGAIGSNQTICSTGTPAALTETTAVSGGYSAAISNGTSTYAWQYSTGCTGTWTTISGATSNSYTFTAPVTSTTCYRRQVTDKCGNVAYSNTITITVIGTSAAGLTGSGYWYVSVYNNATIGTSSFAGYYTETSLSFATTNRWAVGASPSSANTTNSFNAGIGYQGCAVTAASVYTFQSKRTGIPCGYYTITGAQWDDNMWLYIDGTLVSSCTCCTDAGNGTGPGCTTGALWTGYIGTNTVVEFDVTNTGGNSQGGLTFTNTAALAVNSTTGPVCATSTTALTTNYLAPTGGTSSWAVTSGGTYGSISGTSLVAANSTSSSQTVTVQATVEGCTASQNITVEPVISYGTATDASGATQTICSNAAPAGNMVASGAAGSASYNYQWYYQSGIVTAPSGTSTAGWTACTATQGTGYNTATFAASAITASTTYACLVTPAGSPACGTATWATGAMQITVLPALSYGTSTDASGTTQTICYNTAPVGNMTTSGATGSTGFTYQWYYKAGIQTAPSGTSTTGWTACTATQGSGFATATFTASAITASTTYACYVTPTGSPTCGTATWATGAIQITVLPTVSYGTSTDASGTTQTICYNAAPAGNMTTSGATGSTSFTYQWYYQSGIQTAPTGTSTTGWTACTATQGSGFATATFTASAITASTTYACYVTPTGSPTCGTATWATGAIQITVLPALSYGTSTDASGTTQTICNNTAPAGNMTTSGATGSTSFTYQWYYQSGIQTAPSGTSTTGWTACTATQGSGFATATFTASAITTSTTYACFVTPTGSPTCGTATWATGAIQITVLPALNYGTSTDASGTTQTICYNAAPAGNMTTSGATGSTSFTYQWFYKSGIQTAPSGTSTTGWTACTATQGSGFATATFTASAITTSTTYACYVTPTGSPTCGTATWATGAIQITVLPSLSYGTSTDASGTTQTICYNAVPAGNMTTSGATGSTSFTYQWYYQSGIQTAPSGTSTTGWTACTATQGSGFATATFTASAITTSTTYACFVTPAGSPTCGTASWATGAIQITVLPALNYGTSTDASGTTQTICYNTAPAGNMTTSGATGSTSFTYQWYYKSGIQTAPSGTSTTGWTACTATQGSGFATATFTASAITTSTTYACLVTPTGSPTCGTATWATGAMQITVQPAINYGAITSGSSQAICTSGTPTGTFTVSGATGSAGFSYQWYYQANNTVTNPGGTTSLTGWTSLGSTGNANTASFTPQVLTTNTSYACYVTPTGSPTCGTATFASGVINVTVDPVVSNYGTITASAGTSQSLCPNVTPAGTFTVTGATGGSGSFSYQWYSQTGIQSAPSGAIPGSWTLITNATNATYAPSGTSFSVSYACAVAPSGAPACAGSNTWASGVLNFTVSTPTSFITGGNDSVCVVAASVNTLTASTGFTATWQWQNSTDDLTFADISGATNSTYAAPTSTTGELYYHAIATYSGGSGCTPATSNNEYVYVTTQPSITTSPGSLSLCQDSAGYLGAVFTGGVGATYQWQTNYGFGYSNVSDNNSNAPGITYSGTGNQNPLDVISSGSSYTGTLPFKLIISFSGTGCTASATTSAGSVTINHQVVIGTQPASSTSICAGSSTSLTVAATPGFTLSYEWQYNNSGTWGDVANSTPAGFTYTGNATATLSIGTNNGTSPAGSYGYRCIVLSTGTGCNSAVSNTGTIVINSHPATFTPTASSNPVCITSTGGGTNIQVASSVSGVNYQLQNVTGPTNVGSAVAGTGSSINLPTGSMSASTTYQVVATIASSGCSTTSTIQDTVIAVNPDIAIGTQVTSNHYTFGTTGSPALPSGWSNPGSGGLQWTLATTSPASSGSYSYFNGSGGTSNASTGAYITTPTGASTTTVSLISGTLNTMGYTNISVQWGAQKSAGYAGAVNLYYSTDNGGTWSSAVSFTDVQNNVSGNPWSLVNNGVQIKLPAACNNISTLKLEWTANAASAGVYYSMNDIGIYGLSTVTNCGGTAASVPYLNTSCSASKYSVGTSTTTWSAYPSLATVTNATLPSSPVSITLPSPTTTGTYDVDLTVNDGAGHSTATISFPVTTDPAMSFISKLDNCSCNNNSAVFGNIVSVYAAGGAGSYYFSSGAVVDSLKTTIDASGTGYAGTANHSGVKAVFWSKADGATHTYTVSDGVCSTTTSKVTQTTTPSSIPFANATGVPSGASGNFGGGNGISGSFNNSGEGDPTITSNVNGLALTCHQTAEFGNNWVTYQVNNLTSGGVPVTGDSTNNKAVVEINNNGFNLDSVSVSIYRDATLPQIPNSATTTTACYGYQGYALERHFMIKSTRSTGANAFSTPVGVRLYFTDAEFQDLKYWTMQVAATATGQSAGCAYLDTVTNMNSIYVTKYTGPNEDGNYLNNTEAPTGLYRVFGKMAVLNGNSPLTAIDGQAATLTTGGSTNLHYVQMNVTEFSEFWLGGSSGGDPLPVSMLYLQAQALNNDSIQVSWATATEVNNHEFDVERSTDAQTWTTISVVQGHDNSTQEIDYAYNDLDVVPGIRYYYRLKQVDNNGNYTYTDVVQAMITGTGTFTVMNFVPNPTVGNTQLTVVTTKNQQITVDFYDMLGQRVMSDVEELVPGHNAIDFDLRKFAAGTYSAVVTSENQLYTKKIVITR